VQVEKLVALAAKNASRAEAMIGRRLDEMSNAQAMGDRGGVSCREDGIS
jgi:hypothetical protein